MDSFLHLPPSLFKRLITGRGQLPLVSVIKDSKKEAELMWAVEDDSAPETLKFIVQPFNAAHNIPFLRRALVGVEEAGEDWRLVHEHWAVLEETILDQIRLVKKGSTVQIWAPFKPSGGPVQLLIEDFDAKSQYGVIDSNTELIIVPKVPQQTPFQKKLQILPGLDDDFVTSQMMEGFYQIGDFNVKLKKDDSIPPEFIRIPYYLIETVFKTMSKQCITCTNVSKAPKQQFTFQVLPQGQTPSSIAFTDSMTTLDCCSQGCAIIKSDSEQENIYYKPLLLKPSLNGPFAEFLMKPFSVALIEGKIGAGKSVAIKEAKEALEWSPHFHLPIEYIDLCEQKQLDFPLTPSSCLFILDHFDEFVEGEDQEESGGVFDEERAASRFKAAVKRITGVVQKYGHRVVLLLRSSRTLQKYWRTCSLPIDQVYKFESLQKLHSVDSIVLNPSFGQVFGAKDILHALQKNILNPIKYASLYSANGLKLQTGVLLSGPSGSGKSFLAQAFLKAHGIHFLACRGPELLDKYVGASEQAIRGLFEQARQRRPCVLFFDEFDSLVPQRGSNHSGVTDRIVNQFLTELDGTGDRSGVFLLACSSRKDLIDKAIMRPGRMDHCIELKLPTTTDLIKEIQGMTQLEHKDLIVKYLQTADTSLSWADLKLLSACSSGDEVGKLLAKLEIPKKEDKPKIGKRTQKLQLA